MVSKQEETEEGGVRLELERMVSLLTIRASAFCGGETRGKEEEGIAGREAIA